MKVMWAPWRMDYVLGPKADSCPFCLPCSPASAGSHKNDKGDDAARLIVHRGKFAFVLLNKFPYNNGHLMVTPYRHVMNLEDLTPEESRELMELVTLAARALKKYATPEGINIGLNLGRAAGAGIADHLHFHLVPRWVGDSSFIAVMDEVRMVPQHIRETYRQLSAVFKELAS